MLGTAARQALTPGSCSEASSCDTLWRAWSIWRKNRGVSSAHEKAWAASYRDQNDCKDCSDCSRKGRPATSDPKFYARLTFSCKIVGVQTLKP